MNMGYGRETVRVKGAAGRIYLSRSGQSICPTLVGGMQEFYVMVTAFRVIFHMQDALFLWGV